jgi:ribA/ribD-fused uncharacterized protein
MIDSFSGEFDFLSNFFPCNIEFEGEVYPSVEHAFQAAKTLNLKERQMIRKEPTPGKAKRLGKNVLMRDNWDTIKVDVMRSLVTQKFSNDPNLQEKLLSTFDRPLVEGNHWKDTFWGSM